MTQLGAPGLTEQPTDREFVPQQGWQTIREWHGSQTAVDGFLSQLIQSGYRIRRFRVDGSTYGVSAEIPDAQDGAAPSDDPANDQTVTWELVGNDLNKDIFDHPNYEGLSDVEKIVLDELRRTRNFENANLVTINPGSTGDKFKQLIEIGTESFPVSQYVLRRTGTVSITWNGQFAMTNVGKVYASTSDLETAESVPAGLKFILPTGEWLKRTPSVRQERDGRWNITNEFWHADSWADVLYDYVT